MQRGFTLIELMTAMTIGLVIIAGVVGTFVSQTKVQSAEKKKVELLADLQTATQMVRAELRMSQDVYVACSNMVFYQPLDSYSSFPPKSCSNSDLAWNNGLFEYRSKSNCTAGGTTPCIFWNRPGLSTSSPINAEELMRNIKASGLIANKDSYGVVRVDIYAQYQGIDHNFHDIVSRSTIWPRNSSQ